MVDKNITRTDLLNFLAEKYNLQKYVEIGVQDPKQNFDKIICKYKIAVDPSDEVRAMFYADDGSYRYETSQFFKVKSDSFFESWQRRPSDFICTEEENKRDLIFIDGLHTAEQVKKDFENALKILSPNGFIVLHDCNPEKEEHTIVPRPTPTGHWNGDVWKFCAALYGYDRMERVTVDIDNGCMVFKNNGGWAGCNFGISEMPWVEFDRNRRKYLDLITWDEFIRLNS